MAAASSAGNRTTHTVTIPSTVQAGDTLVMFLTTASITGTVNNPTGWTLLQGKDGTATRGRAWTKQATAGDASSTSASPRAPRSRTRSASRPTAAAAAPRR